MIRPVLKSPAWLLTILLISAGAHAQQLLLQAVEQNYSTNPEQSLVNVNGQVRKYPASSTGNNTSQPTLMPANLTVLGAQPSYDNTGLLPAAGVEVRFWQPDQPAVFFTAQTDEQGHYLAGLSEGEWIGEACGSDSGFYPAAWRLSIMDEKLVSMQALEQKNIQLDEPVNNLFEAQSTVTLNGSGFGCNGSLVITYSNAVDRCGVADAVSYDHEVIRISEFVTRTDTRLSFVLPQLDADRSVGKHIAFIRYQQGNVNSPSVLIGERVLPDMDSQFCPSQQVEAATTQVEVVTTPDGQPVFADAVTVEETNTNASSQNQAQTTTAATTVSPQDSGKELTIKRTPKRRRFGGGS